MPEENPPFTFIDLFAGIGGIRIAFEKAGGECVFTSENDKYAKQTYRAFFPDHRDLSDVEGIDPEGDITKTDPSAIPDHDILTGGFPCQPFSLAGVSKKQSLGRSHGFDDPTKGTLFFNIKEIISEKKPKAFLLENVKHLVNHDGGKTFGIISKTLTELGYNWSHEVIDAAGWVPQHRERTYIVGFRKPELVEGQDWEIDEFSKEDWARIKPPSREIYLKDILENEEDVPERYMLGPGTWNTLVRHKANHQAKGHGFGFTENKKPYKTIARTISARYHKDGAEILIETDGPRPRRLTPLECSRLMGFDKKYQEFFTRNNNIPQPVSDTQAYRQFGNSVAVPVVVDIAKEIVRKMIESGALYSK